MIIYKDFQTSVPRLVHYKYRVLLLNFYDIRMNGKNSCLNGLKLL